MNKIIKFFGLTIALGCNLQLLYFVIRFFLTPKLKIEIFEPNRIIAGIEILLLLFSMIIIYSIIGNLAKK